MAEAVKVIVRCRPMNAREKSLNCLSVVKIDNGLAQCSISNPSEKRGPPKSFTFDGAYGVDSTTEQIYADIGYPLVEGVTEGYNGTIFAYGQTGCGKSFSMQGITDPATQRGIIPRAFDHIFETITVSEGAKYLVHASYLEIYNEDVRDLLGKDVKTKLDLKEHPDRGVYVQGLSMHACKNVRDCETIMEKGWKNRSTGSTLMNADSSRSHSIFSIHLERCDQNEDGEEHIRAAKLNLVDLAGSERQGKTGATGDRLKEATKINLSLSALGNVISALVDGKSKHIPYRDSKLTRLLQDSLGGNTKTLMVACLSPADNNYDETLSTLRYANRAKNIKNKPKINEDPKDALLREYQDEITKLRAMLRGEIPVALDGSGHGLPAGQTKGQGKSQTKVVEKVVTVHDTAAAEEEKKRIRKEYEQEMHAMKSQFEEMKLSKEALEEEMGKLRYKFDDQMQAVDSHVVSPGQNGDLTSVASREQMSPREAATHDAEDAEYLQRKAAQAAVHLATVSTTQEDRGPSAPRSSPTGLSREDLLKHDEALKRLQELQQQMVGGEQVDNEEAKKRRQKKKRHAEERNKKLKEAIANKDGDEILLDIYDSVQEELRVKSKILQKEKQKNESLQQEILDLQSEFEFDRIDYLDTIRKQERQMKWLQAVVDKIHPCLRRDCNYVNLDRIKAHSEWDEINQTWIMPKMIIEKSKLPPTGQLGVMPGARQEPTYRHTNGELQPSIYDDLRSEDRYLQKLNQSNEQEIANNYFKSKRTDKLLRGTQEDRNRKTLKLEEKRSSIIRPNRRKDVANTSPNGYAVNGFGGSPGSGSSSSSHMTGSINSGEDRAAHVHGQSSQDEFLSRKPTRLESLPQPGGKSARKKGRGKVPNTMEHY